MNDVLIWLVAIIAAVIYFGIGAFAIGLISENDEPDAFDVVCAMLWPIVISIVLLALIFTAPVSKMYDLGHSLSHKIVVGSVERKWAKEKEQRKFNGHCEGCKYDTLHHGCQRDGRCCYIPLANCYSVGGRDE